MTTPPSRQPPSGPDLATPQPPARRQMPAGHAIGVVIVALTLGAVLNAEPLADAAGRRPFGWQRTAAVLATGPLRVVSSQLGLTEPRRLLARVAPSGDAVELSAAPAPPAPVAPASRQLAAGPSPHTRRPPSATASAGTSRRERRATRRQPLRVFIAGDSLLSEFGPALANRSAATGKVEAELDFRYSTGLARPDFFDWPEHLASVARSADPDVFVVMFGANDGQNLEVDGNVLSFGSAPWRRAYARRVGTLMDNLSDRNRAVYWIGQPVMRSPEFQQRMSALNDVYSAEAEHRPGVTFVDTTDLFADARGAFAAYLTDDAGRETLMRHQDGVHLSRAGGERLAAVVFDSIAERWSLAERS